MMHNIFDSEGDLNATYTLTALGRLDDGSYTACDYCNRHPIRRYYIVANYIWVENEEIIEGSHLLCQRCTNERVDHILVRDQQARIRAEGQRRRLEATRPGRNTPYHGPFPSPVDMGQAISEGMAAGIARAESEEEVEEASSLLSILQESIAATTSAATTSAAQASDGLSQLAQAAAASGRSQQELGDAIAAIGTAFEGTEPTQCLAADLPEVPNGNYTYESHEHAVYLFSIWTVLNSASNPELNGRRIIRRYSGTRWRGFAFLMSDGSLQTWRRFRGEIGSDWHNAAIEMLEALSEGWPIVRARQTDELRRWRRGRGWTYQTAGILTSPSTDIDIAMACRVCNESTNMQWTSGLCAPHYNEWLSANGGISTDDAIRILPLDRQSRQQPLHDNLRRANQEQRRQRPLALDELGHGEIL